MAEILGLIVGRVVLPRGTPGAGVIAVAGTFDLDHVGAEIAEDLPDQWPREDSGEIDDPNAVERPRLRHGLQFGSNVTGAVAARRGCRLDWSRERDLWRRPRGPDLQLGHRLHPRDAQAAQLVGPYGGRVQTRFPPEPNGFLHIGHAKSICLNFGVADEFGGTTMLRFDDTNPETEDERFVEAIQEDVRWLGFEPEQVVYASDYFDRLHSWAVELIEKGLAYVDDQDAETISENRGGFTTPGVDSPWRDRSVEENLDLFERMTAGEFAEGSRVLRAKIDMNHENMQMRDPVMYRIRDQHHFRPGDRWKVYPTYDWAHGQSDAIEGTTHSLCTLEFDSHRPLYDWYLEQLGQGRGRPRQTEFARLNLTHTVMSKRKLLQLVEEGHVDGWDDARMPTIRGLRVGAIRRRRSVISPATSASPRSTAPTRSNCSSRLCARTTTRTRSGAWSCSTRSRS